MKRGVRVRLFLLGLFLLFGGFLLRATVTGFIVSETCCVPDAEGCLAENACTVLQSASPPSIPWIGLVVVLLSLSLVVGEIVWERYHRREQQGPRVTRVA